MVRVEHLSKRFGPRVALDRVSFQLMKGEILGLLGPNGAGKTTAMRILTGYFPPNGGKVFIEGRSLYDDPQALKKRIGYLPENLNLYPDMRVLEFLEFVSRVKAPKLRNRDADLGEKMYRCGVWNVRNRLIGALSKGFRQRLGLTQALIGDPDVLLLDEPTSGLDPKQITEIRMLMKELGRERTLVLSTHILPEVSMVCDRVLILNEGRVIAEGTSDELEARLRMGQEIHIVVGERHRKEEILGLLQGLPYIERVTLFEEKGDRLFLDIVLAQGGETRPELSRFLVEHKIPLLEMKMDRVTLEEIYLRIVVSEPTAEVRR